MEVKMKKIFFTIIIMLVIITGVQSATVFVDPATQDSPNAGGTLSFSVKVKDVADLVGYQFELSFDKTAIKFLSIEEGDFLKTGLKPDTPDIEGTVPSVVTNTGKSVAFKSITPEILSDINSAGAFTVFNVRYSTINKTGVDGAGILVGLKFEVIEAKGSKIEINNAYGDPNINPAVLLDSNVTAIAADLVGGVINQPPPCVKGDVNSNGLIQSNDAILVLRIVAELLVPTTQQLCAADANGDGKVKANDAITILRKVVGLGAPDKDLFINGTLNVKLEETHGIAGGSITVPLKIDQTNVVAGGDIVIAYDSSVLRAVDVSSNSSTLMASNVANPGIIKISFADSTGTVTNTLAEIKFDVISDNTSPLTLQSVELYESNSMPLKLRKIDGLFGSWAMPAKNNALLQNYPNPFNPETWIPFQLKQDSEVTIKIYKATGELVRELDLGNKYAGIYVSKDRSAYWDGKDKFGTPVASGIYFYSIKTKDFSAVKKLTILK
jgi:hypothetical protein